MFYLKISITNQQNSAERDQQIIFCTNIFHSIFNVILIKDHAEKIFFLFKKEK